MDTLLLVGVLLLLTRPVGPHCQCQWHLIFAASGAETKSVLSSTCMACHHRPANRACVCQWHPPSVLESHWQALAEEKQKPEGGPALVTRTRTFKVTSNLKNLRFVIEACFRNQTALLI